MTESVQIAFFSQIRGDEMRENGAEKTAIETLLAREGAHPIPQPAPDLASRTVKRIQNWVVLGDLLRFATLESLWKALGRRRGDANTPEEGQDS